MTKQETDILNTTTASTDAILSPLIPVVEVLSETTLKGDGMHITPKEGVPNLAPCGYSCIRFMTNCTGGYVFLGKKRIVGGKVNDYVVIKQFPVDEFADYELLAKEAANLRIVSHNNIIRLDKCFVYEQSVFMITEACSFGSLHDIVANHKQWGIAENAARIIFRQLLEALSYLHNNRYIHRNIRPQHILISSNGEVKLSGLRFMTEASYQLDNCYEFDSHFQNQLYYFAPEVLAQNMSGYGRKSDVYMIGITLCEVLNGVIPFVEADPLEMLYRKLNGQVPRPVDMISLRDDVNRGIDISGRPTEHLTREFTLELHDFVSQCLVFDPENRPTSDNLLVHTWLKFIKNKEKKIIEELGLNPFDFNFESWKQEPIMPVMPEQTYKIAFDYSSLN